MYSYVLTVIIYVYSGPAVTVVHFPTYPSCVAVANSLQVDAKKVPNLEVITTCVKVDSNAK